MPTIISSLGNDHVKRVVKLNSRRFRNKQQQTIVEGVREISAALQYGILPQEAYLCPALIQDPHAQKIATQLLENENKTSTKLFEVTPQVFQKIAYRGESGGILLIIPCKQQQLEDLHLGDPPFLAIIEGVEKPGNLGGILRTADAAGVDSVIVCNDQTQDSTDIYNPNVIRASLGALFSVPTISVDNGRLHNWLLRHNIKIIAATPAASKPYTDTDMSGPTAIVMGSEAYGLSNTWLENAHEQVTIPMFGTVDSLNLSVSTALLLYEAVRQRNKTVKTATKQ
ncbi:MAG: RNA methyltransferase [Anaerolineae bacterium]|nr:RNA methyltransferase [Anaerolineae bacterium]